MKAAIYCRVSTEGQEQDGTSLQTQLEACQKYCQVKGYEVFCSFNEAWSGLSLERPRLAELRELVRSESIDAVVVYSLDRLTRELGHGVILTQGLKIVVLHLKQLPKTWTIQHSEAKILLIIC